MAQPNLLEYLNLSYNFLNDHNCDMVAEIIHYKNHLRELYIKWNKITHIGSENIFFKI